MPASDWITDEIFTVSDFLDAAECAEYIQLAESMGFTDAPINTAGGAEVVKDIRNNTRVMVDDVDRARQLWRRAAPWVPKFIDRWRAVGINERLRFYRYDFGQRFEWHYDGAFERPDGEHSKLTFMIYLNDDFEGGQTAFEEATIVPRQGMALFFVHQILHRGEPVLKGRKYVLRSDVMYRIDAAA